MKVIKILICAAEISLIGCDNQAATQVMPEVNDSNCRIERIQKIDNKIMRENFASKCSRRTLIRGENSASSKPINWLELADPK